MSDVPANVVYSQGLAEVTAGSLNANVQLVPTLAALRNFVPLDTMTVILLGEMSPGDGGQGVYRYSTSATATDSFPDVVQPNGVPGAGRWLLLDLAGSGGGDVELWNPGVYSLASWTQGNIGDSTAGNCNAQLTDYPSGGAAGSFVRLLRVVLPPVGSE